MKNQREQNIEALIAKCRPVMALQDKAFSTEKQYLFYLRDYLRFTFTQPRDLTSERKFENWLSRKNPSELNFTMRDYFFKNLLQVKQRATIKLGMTLFNE